MNKTNLKKYIVYLRKKILKIPELFVKALYFQKLTLLID